MKYYGIVNKNNDLVAVGDDYMTTVKDCCLLNQRGNDCHVVKGMTGIKKVTGCSEQAVKKLYMEA